MISWWIQVVIATLLRSNGPLPEESGSIEEYEAVFNRGLIELIDLVG